ncbi:MAG: Acetamidase [Candidatus Carbobacillus altaicus]|uniref:Acetamidase n=1 Tax=Candidatus Carbonibacillus altaicus TaxID=2163959 RepID=A0A2R6Y1S4_9BACL|nr:MAG: Acetamidase [Candidatus Carbobacillus altaicus]
MQTFKATHLVYSFSKDNPVYDRLIPGEVYAIETVDCYRNQLVEEHTGDPAVMPIKGINPVTGPFYIEGAESGDTLAVDILDIHVEDVGTIYLRPGSALYGKMLAHAEVRRIPIGEEEVLLPGGFRIPKEPMIGVIGTTPAEEAVSTISPGRHGGNMDTRLITAGSRLYLPVFVDGALFALGDLHAAMGDGESGCCGVEVAGRVKLRFQVIKGRQEPWPFLETRERWVSIASGLTLDEAAREAGLAMLAFLKKRTKASFHDLARLLSVGGHLQISQIVNDLRTARMAVAKMSIGTPVDF